MIGLGIEYSPCYNCDKTKCSFCELAKYKNSQICKVGDTVYQTDGIRIYELEVFDVSLRKGKPYYETESIDFDNMAIGNSIFLTKEEAEAELERKINEHPKI